MKTKVLTFIIFSIALVICFVNLVGTYGQTLNASSELAFAFFGGLMVFTLIKLLFTYLFQNSND